MILTVDDKLQTTGRIGQMNATNLPRRDDKQSEDKAGREGVAKRQQHRWLSSGSGPEFVITELTPK